ncbi:hypothetical protein GCM10022278_34220 [Allohahella marinimesophila]|uniref:Flagellar assembly T-like protein n=2 Tax=Allohahella marinimesophila TaxID=1054972 RepID=A0ABP7Q028_9GAMM
MASQAERQAAQRNVAVPAAVVPAAEVAGLPLREKLSRGQLRIGVLQWQGNGAWVRAIGEAPVIGGDAQAARVAAQKDALRNAALSYEADISSSETMEGGRLLKSKTTLSTRARATQVVWNDEQLTEGSILMAVEAFMQPLPLCPAEASQSAHLRRSVAVTGFRIDNAQDAGLGRLNDFQRSFPARVGQFLKNSERLDPVLVTDINVLPDARNAPASNEHGVGPQQSLGLAEDFGTQFIVSGVIRRMDVESADAYSNSVYTSVRDLLGTTNKQRWFEADLFIHDGFSGALIYQQRYQVQGRYDAEAETALQMDDAAFLNMPYGQAVISVARQMAADVEANTACQPFMTRIAGLDDKRVMLKQGSVTGIRPGDRFQVYRSRELYMDGEMLGRELLDLKLVANVSHVQPLFSLATLPADPGRYNVQKGDVLIFW